MKVEELIDLMDELVGDERIATDEISAYVDTGRSLDPVNDVRVERMHDDRFILVIESRRPGGIAKGRELG